MFNELIDRVLCWWGLHKLNLAWRIDEARWWGVCEHCKVEGPLDSQGWIDHARTPEKPYDID